MSLKTKICLIRVRCQRTALGQSGKDFGQLKRLPADNPRCTLAGLTGRKNTRADEPADDDGSDRELLGRLRQDQFAAFLTFTLAIDGDAPC